MKLIDIKNKLSAPPCPDLKTNNNDDKELNRFLSAIGEDHFSGFHPASVLILLKRACSSAHWNIILTKRASHLKHHPGEISFPGGRYEETDESLVMTARRETHEEIGILPDNIEILGKLPQQKTISGYLVTPYVGYLKECCELHIDKNEVELTFEVPMDFALSPHNHQRVQREIAKQVFYFYQIQYNQHRIWGATAKMLVNLSRILATPN